MEMNQIVEDHGQDSDCDCQKNNNYCLHRAIQDKNKDLERVKEIIRETAGRALLRRNSSSELPLHLACKDEENSEIVQILLGHNRELGGINYHKQEQLEAENEVFGNTPLHVAASLGNHQIVKIILSDRDINPSDLLKKQNKLKDTPVHNAASRGHVSILEEMHDKVPDCISNKGRFKGRPLHSACGYGRLNAAKKLLEWSGDKEHLKYTSVRVNLPAFTKTTESRDMELRDKERIKNNIEKLRVLEDRDEHPEYTPLTRACQFGHKDIVEHLLVEGDEPHPMALVKAIEGLYTDCVKLLLFKNKFRKHLLHVTYIPDGSSVSTTPFRELIKHMPDVAESVLHRSVELERFLVNSENFKIKLNYEFVDDDGENWMRDNRTEEMTAVCCRSGDNSDQTDYSTPQRKIGFNKETHPLSLMIKHEREKLITHPVVAGLIYDKWNSLYGVFSLLQWAIYTLFLGCINALLFQLPNPRSGYCVRGQPEIATNSSCSNMLSSNNASDCDDIDIPIYNGNNMTLLGLASMAIVYSTFRLLLELYQLGTSTHLACSSLTENGDATKVNICLSVFAAFKRITYIWSLNNWIEVPLFILSPIFAAVVIRSGYGMSFCLIAWQWQIGVIVILLSWIEFIFLSTQFRLIGVHALMFIRVLKTMLKFIPLALLLILAFGLTFHFLLYQPELKASPYFTPGYSFLKTLSMTAGDVGSDTFFGFDINGQVQNNTHLQYLSLSTFVWLLSLLLMTILLSNLLIGLAVGDIQTIHDKAQFEKLKLQIDYVLTVESQIRISKCMGKCRGGKCGNKSTKEFEPNKTPFIETLRKELVYLIWGGVRYDSPESIKRLISDSSVKK